jgi:predicted subunit of tRNA(5-methylaminomethyl-2-thiouridylate) methyltransferase
MANIDLGRLTRGEVRMLTGHPRGLAAREFFELDTLFNSGVVSIVAPDEIDTITPSFLQGFLARSIDQLGSDVFVQRVQLGKLPSHLRKDFETGIRRLLLRRGEDTEALIARLH